MAVPAALFLCTGNSARSQMGEAWLRHFAGDRLEVHSAGMEPKGIHPLTERVLAEAGLETSGQRSKSVEEYLGRDLFSYVIVVCSHAQTNCPRLFPGVNTKLYWPFDDPAAATGSEAEQLAVFRRVCAEVRDKVEAWVAELEATGAIPAQG